MQEMVKVMYHLWWHRSSWSAQTSRS